MARYGIGLRLAKYLCCTAEHLVAQQDGGKDTEENVAAACLWCNRMRHLKLQHKAPSSVQYKNRVTQFIAERRWHPAIGILRSNFQSS